MNWYLKKADGQTVYGPVDEKNLEAWAADGRVAPNDQVSTDRREWRPAPTVPALKMEWVAQLPGGGQFGPVSSQAFRELIRNGELKPDTPVQSAKSGQATTLSALMADEEKPSAAEVKWKAEADAARKAAADAEARAGQSGAALKTARETLARTEQDRDQALQRAERAESEAASAIEKARSRAEKAEQDAAEGRATVQRQAAELQAAASRLASAQAEAGKWKEQCEQARTAAAEAEKSRQAALQQPAPPPDTVPREQLDEALRRIAHLERSYKQALQAVQRNLSARVGHNQPMPPEQLRRRDIA